jgi:hypothetical protein
MMRLKLIVFAWISVLMIADVVVAEDNPPQPDPGLKRLSSWMIGSFSSQEQAEGDSNFLDIRLQMVPVWGHRDDGLWLYVEQAAAGYLDRPYRQRVYHLVQYDDSTYCSEVYVMPAPLRFAGAWREENPLAGLTLDSLAARTGCTIFLRPEGDSAFVGSTRDRDCLSSLRGASYATSEVRITPAELYSWDRGFNDEGEQVWGAVTGGYRFLKLKSDAASKNQPED